MVYQEVYDAVNRIKKKYDEKDPVKLCRQMGILLIPKNWGTAPDCLKGFYTVRNRIKAIAYNCELPLPLQHIIIFHEIGHSVLHRGQGTATFSDVTMFDTNSLMENEANLFAAEYMLDDAKVIETLNEDFTFFGSAARLGVPGEFLDFKFRIMKWKGYRLSESPIAPKSSFLKNVEVHGYYE